MKQESIQAMREFTARAREAFDQFVDGVEDAEYVKAAELILASRQKGGRLHITGIGKPGHVSGYGASLLSSTGTPSSRWARMIFRVQMSWMVYIR